MQGQSNIGNLTLGVNLGYIPSQANTHIGAGLDLSLKYKFIRFRLEYFSEITSFGRDVYRFPTIPNYVDEFGYEHPARRRFENYQYFQFSPEFHFKIDGLSFHSGVGLVLQKIKGYTRYEVRLDELVPVDFSARNRMGFNIYNSLEFGRTEFYVNIQFPFEMYLIGIKQNFSLTKKSDQHSDIELLRQRKERTKSKCLVNLKYAIELPFGKDGDSQAMKFSIGSMIPISSKLTIFGEWEFGSESDGADDHDPLYIISNQGSFLNINQSHRVANTKKISLGMAHTKYLSSRKMIDLGLGLTLNHFKGPSFAWEQQGVNLESISKFVPGVMLKAQLRNGPFENGINLNFPFSNLSPSISYYWAVGINFRKKSKKIKK